MSHANLEICLAQIRGIHGLPPHACCADIVAKVRETKAAADRLQSAADPDCLEGPGRTREQMARDHADLQRVAPTAADKFDLMFRGTRDHRIV
jgi:hypothetical protein